MANGNEVYGHGDAHTNNIFLHWILSAGTNMDIPMAPTMILCDGLSGDLINYQSYCCIFTQNAGTTTYYFSKIPRPGGIYQHADPCWGYS